MSSNDASSSDEYVLARTLTEINRLNLQHFFWKKHLGWILDPEIPTDKPDLAVADVGTGTGVWLFDLADELPKHVTYTGFDVDISQAPHAGFLPPNTTFDVFDALAPLTPDMADKYGGKFDVVNVRFFIWVVRDNDPSTVLENCFKLLKPGGYLQWAEANMLPEHQHDLIAPGSPEKDASGLNALRDAFLRPAAAPAGGLPGAWIARLDKYMADVGFARARRTDVPGAAAHPTWAAMQMGTTLLTYANVIAQMPDGPQKHALRALHARAVRAMKDGVAWGVNWITHVAQKPE